MTSVKVVSHCNFDLYFSNTEASQVVLVVKNLPANAGDIRDWCSIPVSGRSPGEGNGNSLQFSCQRIHGQRSLVGHSPWGSQRVGQD